MIKNLLACILLALISATISLFAHGATVQDDINVQVKVYDIGLNATPDLSFQIDAFPSLKSNEKGLAFITVPSSAMPPKNIAVDSEELEVESWNYSKGILEIIIRKKSYRQISVSVIDLESRPLPSVGVSTSELKSSAFQTDEDGKLSLKLPLATDLGKKDLFGLDGFNIVQRRINDNDIIIVASKIIVKDVQDMDIASLVTSSKKLVDKKSEDLLFDLNLETIDSINSLTVMYSLMNKINYLSLDSLSKKRLDRKFKNLMAESMEAAVDEENAVALISDSSIINEDILTIIEKIKIEEQLLSKARIEFEQFTEQIDSKLKAGGQDLTKEERKQLMQLVFNLKDLLRQNEDSFYRNNEVYRDKLDGLLSQLANIHELEDMLSESELINSKTKEQLVYVFFGFATFVGITLLLTFLVKTLKNQRMQLSAANEEITRINSNLEDIVAQKTESLELINEELDTFLYRSSHNLKRPLTSIRGLAGLAEISLSREALALFDKVVTTTVEMEKMLDKLTMMNHINQPANFAQLDIESIVQRIMTQYDPILVEQNINFKVNIHKEIKFKSFPTVIEIMITNLLENAFFFCRYNVERNPQVELTFSQNSRRKLLISIHDNGCGITEHVQKHMWDMFFIGNDLSKGSGLGLFISKKAVEALNGQIKLDTVLGQYTKFTITLPVIQNSQRKLKQSQQAIQV